jgi:hypothetical protein
MRTEVAGEVVRGLKVSKDVDKGQAAGVSHHVWKIEEIVALLG